MTYWSKKGSKMITSSPSSINAMKALNIPACCQSVQSCLDNVDQPSFAPVVIVTSVSGFSFRPHSGEYESAIAFFRRGRPLVGEYWLQSTFVRASWAACIINSGGL